MVKIKLTRTGKKNAPTYRFIVCEARAKRDSMALEFLGFYNPRSNPSVIEVKKDRVLHWISQGAQPTDTVRHLLVRAGVLEKPKSKKTFTKALGRKATERAALKKEKAAAQEAKPAEAEVVEETAEAAA
jgi:small subunit ribosomal protein S16